MTELEKRAEEYSIREIPFIECISQLDLERLVKQAYLAGATEATKELQEELRLEKIENKDLIERVNELEKENSELKTDNVEWEKASDKWKSLYELTNNQLTTAKEIISEYINILKGDTKNWKKTQAKAEAFLKE